MFTSKELKVINDNIYILDELLGVYYRELCFKQEISKLFEPVLSCNSKGVVEKIFENSTLNFNSNKFKYSIKFMLGIKYYNHSDIFDISYMNAYSVTYKRNGITIAIVTKEIERLVCFISIEPESFYFKIFDNEYKKAFDNIKKNIIKINRISGKSIPSSRYDNNPNYQEQQNKYRLRQYR